jgi:AraC-like DNA-binding protein
MEVLRRTVQNLLKSRANLRSSYSGSQLPVDQVETPKGKSPDERLMERIMKVVNLNLSNPELTSELIAQEVGMSRVHLYRKLRELTNQTARNFIYNIRLAKAAELLAQKKCSVTEVAEMVGFTNASNFASMFKRMYGVSPSTYMDEHVKKNVIVKPLTDEDFDGESAKDEHLMP